ncbi:MAG: hypothetical protein LBI53_04885 [Candidatus Peribacteria bacterium]|jgi:hypothetical protein|nr:hypothetical protein [Candidatus Peribacteria bacterium]
MEQNFNICELFKTLEKEFPNFVVQKVFSENNYPERGIVKGYYPHPRIPSLQLSVQFFHGLSNGEHGNCISADSSFQVEVGHSRIGDYTLICSVFCSFWTDLSYGREDKHLVVDFPPSGFYLPSLGAETYKNDWEPTLRALEFWKEIVEKDILESPMSVLGNLIGTEPVKPLEEDL